MAKQKKRCRRSSPRCARCPVLSHNASRGWRLDNAEAAPFLEKCQELGIRNIHVHKGPTIWPLDKDAFDPRDVDAAATNFPELNFIVEHVGLPRIEDFCLWRRRSPTCTRACRSSPARSCTPAPASSPRSWRELLFWVGDDKLLFGSDYGIWEPKWQVEGLVAWNHPDESFSVYPAFTTASKKKILGLNAAKLYGVDVPDELRLPSDAGTPAAREGAELVEGSA